MKPVVQGVLDRSAEVRSRVLSFGALLREAFFSHFVLCSFIGMYILWWLSRPVLRGRGPGVPDVPASWIAVGSLVNGLLVAGLTWVFHRIWKWRLAVGTGKHRAVGVLLALAFVAGALDVIFFLVPWALVVLTILTVVLVVHHVRSFYRRAVLILRPGAYPGWEDIGYLIHVFATLLAAFTLINATLMVLGVYRPEFQAFSFQGGPHAEGMIDALYFTIVLMTTLGFGDIYPIHATAKLTVSLECLTSYFIFALMIGILTRGILPSGPKPDGTEGEQEEDGATGDLDA